VSVGEGVQSLSTRPNVGFEGRDSMPSRTELTSSTMSCWASRNRLTRASVSANQTDSSPSLLYWRRIPPFCWSLDSKLPPHQPWVDIAAEHVPAGLQGFYWVAYLPGPGNYLSLE
jgi:hypothetical protein